jgi:hypothetical protein
MPTIINRLQGGNIGRFPYFPLSGGDVPEREPAKYQTSMPANAVLSSAIGRLAAGQESSAGCHSPTNERDGRDKGRDNDCG